tara:strand:+ start:567 stop:698 length:132 start_codon:yes stop_codon:yes gene_type:complete
VAAKPVHASSSLTDEHEPLRNANANDASYASNAADAADVSTNG